MIMKIIRLMNHGDFKNERVVLEMLRDGSIVGHILIDNTYDEKRKLSNKVRHPFFFPNLSVKKGEVIRVYTKAGTYRKLPATTNTETGEEYPVNHNLYWGLHEPIWNDEADCALLVEVADHQQFCVRG